MENLPTTCIEAVCCGTPVAGFDVGGTAEIAPAPLGLYCSHGDIDALRENVRQLLTAKIAPEEFETNRNRFSFHRMFSDYDNIYREMLVR